MIYNQKKPMKKLIKINPEHYIVVDDSEIKEKSGDWFYSSETGKVYDTLIHHTAVSCMKITHSTQPLDGDGTGACFINIKQLNLSEVKELLGEVDVVKIGYNESWRRDVLYNQHSTIGEQNAFIDGVKYGYSQCLEDNKDRKYTENDLKLFFEFGYRKNNLVESTFESALEWFTQSIQPTTSWEVEIIDGKLKLIV